MGTRKVTIEEKQEAVKISQAKLKEELTQAKYLFEGLLLPGRPRSEPLAEYYESVRITEIPDIRFGRKVTRKIPTIEQIEEYCKSQSNALLYDPSFPPNDNSLYAMTDPSQMKPLDKRPLIIWKRPTEFFKAKDGDFRLFATIEANDIKQGLLGDCWLMCSLSAAAEFPKIIEQAFVGENDSFSKFGVYQVRLFKEGREETIVLDDYFPCQVMGGPIYCKAAGNELWVMLMEKAFAKYNGSYASLAAGKPFEALIDLTGCPWYEFRFSDAKVKSMIDDGSLFDKIREFDESGYIMSISTAGKDDKSEGERSGGPASGICAGHAYTLYSAVVLSNGVKLFRIRNPWGNFEWTGDWGDDSDKWTEPIKAEMAKKGHPIEKADDGMFWMAFSDVIKYFICVNVVLVPKKHDWYTSRETFVLELGDGGDSGLKSHIYKLTVHEPGHFFFSVHQKDKRIVGSVGYFDFGVTILKRIDLDGDGKPDFEFIESSGNSSERQLQTEVTHLTAGEYWVVPTSTGTKMRQFVNQGYKEFNRCTAGLVVHSQKSHELTVIYDAEAGDEETYEMTLAREHAQEDPVSMRSDRDEKDPYKNGSLIVTSIRNGYAGRSYCVTNHTDNKSNFPKSCYFLVSIDLSDSKNVVSHRGTLTAENIVAPGESEIIHHCFPEKEGVGGFTVSARRNQRKLTQPEIVEYLNNNYEIYTRLKNKNLIDFAYKHPNA